MSVVVSALAPIFLVILAGVLFRRTLIPEDAHWIGLERLTYYVLFPALLIETLAKARLGATVGLAGLVLFLTVLIGGAILVAARQPLSRLCNLDGPAFTSLFQAATRWNTLVALSLAGTLLGEVGVTVVAVAAIAMIPPLNVMSVAVLARYAGARTDWRGMVEPLATNPFIWSVVIGILINLSGLTLPEVIMSFANILGRAALGAGLLLVGAGLRLETLVRPHRATWLSAFWKLVLVPALAAVLSVIAGVGGGALLATLICAGVPTAPNGYVLARQMGGDAPLLAQMITLHTVLAVFTLPLVIALAEALGR